MAFTSLMSRKREIVRATEAFSMKPPQGALNR
jgi:hypothetical protein